MEDFIAIAVVEEYFKRFAVKKTAYYNKEFNYLFDGIVYAVFSALGFAALENILYVLENGLFVALIRAVSSIPAHAIFGIIMGYYLGHAKMAKFQGNKKLEKYYWRKSLLYPVLLHGFYDSAIELNHPILMLVWLIFLIILEVRAFQFIKEQARNDRPL